MADFVNTFAQLSTDAPNVWIARELFRLAERRLQLGQWASKYELPQRFGKTVRVNRYKRLNLPTGPLTEGVPPDAVSMAIENVDITVDQWGIVVLLTDVALITTAHPALQIAIDRTSLAMAEVIEREIAKVLLGGTNVFFPGAVTTRGGLVATNVLDTTTILKTAANLRSAGAAEFEGGLYGGVMSPQQEADVLKSDTTFQSASNFARVKKLEFGEIGIWMATQWVRGNFLPVFKGVATPDTAVITAEKAKLTAQAAGPYTAASTVKIIVVGRDVTNDYERKISQQASFALGAGNSGYQVQFPSSTAYVYDLYTDDAVGGGGTARLFSSRQAASSTVTVGAGAVLPVATAATAPAAPAAGVEVFVAWIFGKDGYGRVELNGMSLESYITPPGASWANPLAQGRKCGAKLAWKPFLLDNAFFGRVETGSFFASTLPA